MKEHWNAEALKRREERLAVASPEGKEGARPRFTRLRWTRGVDHTTKHSYYELQVPNTKACITTFKDPVGEVSASPPKILPEIPAVKRFSEDYIFQAAMRGEKVTPRDAAAVYKTLPKEKKEPYLRHCAEVRRANVLEIRAFAEHVYRALDAQDA